MPDLLGSLFTIISVETQVPKRYRVALKLNASHPVFAGHFPDNPVLPGVCTLRIITECVAYIVGYPVFMSEASQIKYLGVIQPKEDLLLLADITLDYFTDNISLKAAITSDEQKVCACKLKLFAMDGNVCTN